MRKLDLSNVYDISILVDEMNLTLESDKIIEGLMGNYLVESFVMNTNRNV